jgi:hypothetical protein
MHPLNSTTSPNAIVHGWVSQPDGRGTLDIIWSCASTLFICVWVMLHLNVPAVEDSDFTLFIRRFKWFIWGILSPELVMLFAGGQWASAKRSVAEMKEISIGNWSMVHAFYADSGGFVLQTPDYPHFPISAKQLQYLVRNGYMEAPTLTRKEIWDKSKGKCPFNPVLKVLTYQSYSRQTG